MAAADMTQLGMVVEASIAGGWGDRFFLWLSPPRSFFFNWLPCWEAGTDIEYEKECIVLLDSYSYLICANRKSAA